MKRISVLAASLGLVGVIVAPSARGQSVVPTWTTDGGLAIGAAIPQGDRLGPQQIRLDGRGLDMAGGANTGFTVVGSVGIRRANSPLGFRLEAQYTRLGLDGDRRVGLGDAPAIADGNASILNGTANVVLSLPTASRIRPYLVGGVGIYRLSSDIGYRSLDGHALINGAPSESETKFGLNGGPGIEVALGSLRTFVEARFHSVFTEGQKASFIPITMGMRF